MNVTSRGLPEKVPDLVRGVEVAVGAAEQGPAVHCGMGYTVAAALNPDEREIALAGGGPALAFGGAAVVRVGVRNLRPCGRTAEPVELEEVVDARLRGEDGPAVAPHAVQHDVAAVPRVHGVGGAVHEEHRHRLPPPGGGPVPRPG